MKINQKNKLKLVRNNKKLSKLVKIKKKQKNNKNKLKTMKNIKKIKLRNNLEVKELLNYLY